MTKQMPERVYINIEDYSINIQGFKQDDETDEEASNRIMNQIEQLINATGLIRIHIHSKGA